MLEYLTLFNGLADNGVQGLNGLGGVNNFSDVFWVIEDNADILPVVTPGAR